MQTDIFDVVCRSGARAAPSLPLARRGVRWRSSKEGRASTPHGDFNTHAMPFDFPSRQIPTMRAGKAGFDSERSAASAGSVLWNAVALR